MPHTRRGTTKRGNPRGEFYYCINSDYVEIALLTSSSEINCYKKHLVCQKTHNLIFTAIFIFRMSTSSQSLY